MSMHAARLHPYERPMCTERKHSSHAGCECSDESRPNLVVLALLLGAQLRRVTALLLAAVSGTRGQTGVAPVR